MIKLYRLPSNFSGTFGILTRGGVPLCNTCEDPWNENRPQISCIPAGKYQCVPHSGTKYKNVWRLENVPGRSAILIHAGNSIEDTRGCLLVGNGFGIVNGLPSVINSRETLAQLRGILPSTFELEIINHS